MAMTSIGTYRNLSLIPQIIYTHEGLERMKYLVGIAPKEAQWFHLVKVEEDGVYRNYILDNIFIPDQYTSMSEVDTSDEFMRLFYKKLLSIYGEETNSILSQMTCWCHSHHTMTPNPSSQDHKQFEELIKLQEQDENESPQIMIIFNKSNQHYNRIWDPQLGHLFENVPIVLEKFCFDHIKKEAAKNFKQKPVVSKKIHYGKTHGRSVPSWGFPTDPRSYYSVSDSEHLDYSQSALPLGTLSGPVGIIYEEGLVEEYVENYLHKYSSKDKLYFRIPVNGGAAKKFVIGLRAKMGFKPFMVFMDVYEYLIGTQERLTTLTLKELNSPPNSVKEADFGVTDLTELVQEKNTISAFLNALDVINELFQATEDAAIDAIWYGLINEGTYESSLEV